MALLFGSHEAQRLIDLQRFRVIDDGSWASSGGVLSILDLLGTGVFSDERAHAIREALGE